MKLSIIVLVHDLLDYTMKCIDSIQKYTDDYELIIVDNGSRKETQECLKIYAECNPKIRIVRNDENIGFVRGNNEAVKTATGDFIALLNNDTEVFEGWWQIMVKTIESNPNIGQVGARGCHLTAEGSSYALTDEKFSKNGGIDYISGWCFMIPREIYEQFGLFDEGIDFAYSEDAEFSIRLQKAGYTIKEVKVPISHYWQRTQQEVMKTGELDIVSKIDKNKKYLLNKYPDYFVGKIGAIEDLGLPVCQNGAYKCK